MQWHRFNSDSPLHPLIRSIPPIAFNVDDLNRVVTRCTLCWSRTAIEGYRVAIIEDGGVPIELVQTTLADEELWSRAKSDEQAGTVRGLPRETD